MPPRFRFSIGRVGTVGLIATTGYLSVWQANRFFWKRNLIAERAEVINGPPQPLPDKVPSNVVKVQLKGYMQNDECIIVGPKPAVETIRGEIHGIQSCRVFVPFLLAGGELIWVCRGQVERECTREEVLKLLKQWPAVVEIAGMVREASESRVAARVTDGLTGGFGLSQLWDYYLSRHELGSDIKPQPFWIEMTDYPLGIPPPGNRPLPAHPEDYLNFNITPYTHIGYCATWTFAFMYGLNYLRTSTSV